MAPYRQHEGKHEAMPDRIKADPRACRLLNSVARLVLARTARFASAAGGELADRAHVSKPTVVRFCRSVGYDGLADFKRKLAGRNEGVPFVHCAVDEDDKTADIIVKVIDNAVSAAQIPQRRRQPRLLSARHHRAGRGRQAGHGRRIEFFGVGQLGIGGRTRSTSSSARREHPLPSSTATWW